MTQLALVNPAQASKSEITEFGASVNASVQDGLIQAKDALIFATRLALFSEAIITKGLRKLAAEEAEKYAKGDRNYLGCKLTVKEVKGADAVYDFTAVREWRALQDQINEQLAEGETAQLLIRAQIVALEAKIIELWKPINDRIAVLHTRQQEVEKSSITGQADADGQTHEGAKLEKEAVNSTKSVAVQIL